LTAVKGFERRSYRRHQEQVTALKTVLSAVPTVRIKMPTDCAGVTGNGST